VREEKSEKRKKRAKEKGKKNVQIFKF